MRILWLKTELLHPVDKGGKIRTYQMLRELRREHKITYLTLDDGTATEEARTQATEYCHELICISHHTRQKFSAAFYLELAANMLSPLPYFMEKYTSASMRRAIGEQVATGSFDVLVCDFLMPAVNMPPRVACATVLFQHNVEAAIWRRHYEVQSNPLKKAYLYGQWVKTRAYERRACQRFDAVVAVSTDDAEIMRRDYGVSSVTDIPTGVDTSYFQPGGSVVDPANLVFTGSMDWLPNEDAIRYFTEQVFPKIRKLRPDVTLTIVGRNPSPSLIQLGRRDPGIIVTGRVDDVRPYLERAAAFIVPIRIGGGTRLKIYEAMAMAKPIISTSIGAEGLPVRAGTDLLIADSPDDFAASVVRVLDNPEFARGLAVEAAGRVRAHFSWSHVAERFAAVCARALTHRASLDAADRQKEGEEPTPA